MQKRVTPAQLQADRDTLIAAKALSDYAPRNNKYSVASADAAQLRNDNARTRVLRAKAELAAALDEERSSGVEFHEIGIGIRDEVMVQYGSSSDAYASVGRKKRSERKRPVRKSGEKPIS
ncbi:hypothetical protein [Armatimonas sp.]|uniref:hypothetical protein n=1 Tax=Armatimonas sp. TaxID=1872638 RepID=UPI00286A3610|nr:hypothetical protein [Armatimonas sp.]